MIVVKGNGSFPTVSLPPLFRSSQIRCSLFFIYYLRKMNTLWQYTRSIFKLLLQHPIAGTCVIPVLKDGRIVLIQRRESGLWACPGGMVDWGENIPSTVKRELIEETGLELIKINGLVGVYSEVDRDPRFHSICIVVSADVEGSFDIKDTIEIQDVKAFEADNLPFGQLAHDFDRILQDYLNGKTGIS